MPQQSKEQLEAELTSLRSENRRLRKANRALLKGLGLDVRDAAPPQEEGTQVCGVTNHSSVGEKIRLFRSLFRGREDVYPVRWENQKGRAESPRERQRPFRLSRFVMG